MSLINDALKRAQEAQRPNTQSSVSSMRTVDTRPKDRPFTSRLLVVVIFLLVSAAFAFIGLAMTGRLAQKGGATPQIAMAQPVTPTPAVSQPAPAPTPEPVPVMAAAPSIPTQPTSIPAPTPAPAPAAVVVAPVVTPPPTPLVLPETLHVQGIGFNSTRPWAIISGRTVYVGETIKGVRVMGITRSTVTFGNNGQTNLLYVGQ